ncbi:hypothetical protein [Halobellus limi]|uniref:Uncharacterized protein n=1 Tax=Halobellus limi TaxID=699433 RepID=A0A1H5ZII9_9EURY|nr:hypothetical protein [Halobellus limi]QCC48084.1 hypothetical protein DV707_10670 [Halobellus limi]SEG36062.1 hypothetical protein SAMN04488133_2011 [Halobellus limi]
MKDLATLKEMMLRGGDFRSEHETEVFGTEMTLVFKPVPDENYFPVLGVLDAKLGLSEDEAMEEIETALDEVDGDAAKVDLSQFDGEFIGLLKRLCRLGIDPEGMDGDEEMLDEMFGAPACLDEERPPTFGGYVLEWGFEIMDVTGNLRDAKQFRGGRNRS